MEQHYWVQSWHLNAFGSLFGGQVLHWVDEDTNMLAYNSSHKGMSYTTAGYERVSFFRPCFAGDRLKFVYDIIHYGNKSVTIRTVATNQDNAKIFSCLTVMVRTDQQPQIGLLPSVIESISKTSSLWKLVEKIKEDRKKEEML